MRLNELYAKYKDRCRFYLVYIREAHPELRAVWARVVGADTRFATWSFDETGFGVALALPWLAVELRRGGRPWLAAEEAARFADDPLILRELSVGTYDGRLVALDWPRPGLPLEYLNR